MSSIESVGQLATSSVAVLLYVAGTLLAWRADRLGAPGARVAAWSFLALAAAGVVGTVFVGGRRI